MPMRPDNSYLFEKIEVLFRDQLIHASCSKGDTIFWESTEADYVYGIVSGDVKVVRVGFHGKEWIVRLLGRREIVGTSDALDNRTHSASAVALSDVRLWKIPAKTFRSTLSRQPDLLATLSQWMVRLIRNLELSLELFSNGKAEERIANLLARLAIPCEAQNGFCRCIPFRLTRKDMAEMVGVTPETCSRTLSEFKRAGMVFEAPDHKLHINPNAIRTYFHRVENGHGQD